MNKNYSQITKKSILKCFKLMKEYITSEDVEEMDAFEKMVSKVDKLLPAIPEELFAQIKEFISDKLAPIVYERDTTFSACYTDDIGHFEDGTFIVNDDIECLIEMLGNFMEIIFNIDNELDEFGRTVLQPYLIY